MALINTLSRSLAVAAVLIAVGGCQGSPESAAGSKTAAEQTAGQIPNWPATRIISLAPHITELVFAAGAGDKLVGAVEYSDYPAPAQDIPRIGDAFRVDYEAIVRAQPDLILAWQSGTPPETVQQLESLGFTVVALEPATIEDIAAELLKIGDLTGTRIVAEQQAGMLLAEFRQLQEQHAGQQQLSVFFQISAEPLFTVGGSHVISHIIEACGGRNIFAELADIAPAVSTESVIAANPDVILAAAHDNDMSEMQGWKRWQQVHAVANNHLYAIDRDLISRSGPRIIAGVRQVCGALDEARVVAK